MSYIPNTSSNSRQSAPLGNSGVRSQTSGANPRVPNPMNTPLATGTISDSDSSLSVSTSSPDGQANSESSESSSSEADSAISRIDPEPNVPIPPVTDVSGHISGAVPSQVPPEHGTSGHNPYKAFAGNVWKEVTTKSTQNLSNEISDTLTGRAKPGGMGRMVASGAQMLGQRLFKNLKNSSRNQNQQRARREVIPQPGSLSRSGSGSIHTPTEVPEPNMPVVDQAPNVPEPNMPMVPEVLAGGSGPETTLLNRTNPEIEGHQLLIASHDYTGHNTLSGSSSGSSSGLSTNSGSNISRTGSGGLVMTSPEVIGFRSPYPEPSKNSDNQSKRYPLDKEVVSYNLWSKQTKDNAARLAAEQNLLRDMEAQDALQVSENPQNQAVDQGGSNSRFIMPTMSASSNTQALDPRMVPLPNFNRGNSTIRFDSRSLDYREILEIKALNRRMGYKARINDIVRSNPENQSPSYRDGNDAVLIFDGSSLTTEDVRVIQHFDDRTGNKGHWRVGLTPEAEPASEDHSPEEMRLAIAMSQENDGYNQQSQNSNVDSASGSYQPNLASVPESASFTPGQNQLNSSLVPNETTGPSRSNQPDNSANASNNTTNNTIQESNQAQEISQPGGDGNQGSSTQGNTSAGAGLPIQALQSPEDPNPPNETEPPNEIVPQEAKEVQVRFAPNLNFHYNFRGHHLTFGPEARVKYDFNNASWSPSLKLYLNLDVAANKLCFEANNGRGSHTLLGFRLQNGNTALSIDSKRGATNHIPFNHLLIGVSPNLAKAPVEVVCVFDLKKSISFSHILLRPTNAFNLYTKPLWEIPIINRAIEFKIASVPSLQFRLAKFTTPKLLFNKQPTQVHSDSSDTAKIQQNSKQLEILLKFARTITDQNKQIQDNQQQLADRSELNHGIVAVALASGEENTNNVGNITQTLLQTTSNDTQQSIGQMQQQGQECCDITHKGINSINDGLSNVGNQFGEATDSAGMIKNLLAASVFWQVFNAAFKSFFSIAVYGVVTYAGVWSYAKVQRSLIVISKSQDIQPNYRSVLIACSILLRTFAITTYALLVVNVFYNLILNKNFFSLWPCLRGTPLSANGTLISEEFLKKVKAQSILSPCITICSFAFTGLFAFGMAPFVIGFFSGTMTITTRNRGIAMSGSFIGFYLSRKLYSKILGDYDKYQPARDVVVQLFMAMINGIRVILVKIVTAGTNGKNVQLFAFVKGFFFIPPSSLGKSSIDKPSSEKLD